MKIWRRMRSEMIPNGGKSSMAQMVVMVTSELAVNQLYSTDHAEDLELCTIKNAVAETR